MDSIPSIFCILIYAIIYALIHHIMLRLYLYFLNIRYFSKYSRTNIFHRYSLYTFWKVRVVIMPNSSSLVAPKVVITINCSTAIRTHDINVNTIKGTLVFYCNFFMSKMIYHIEMDKPYYWLLYHQWTHRRLSTWQSVWQASHSSTCIDYIWANLVEPLHPSQRWNICCYIH